MQLSDQPGSNNLSSRPAPNPTVAPGWINNDLSQTTEPTISDPDMMNGILGEGMSLLAATLQTPSKMNISQWLQGIISLQAVEGSGGSAPGGGQTASFDCYLGTFALNCAVSGAGGWQDTGSFPTAGAISVYLCFNPTSGTWAAIALLASTASTLIYAGARLPSGYTFGVLICALVTTGGNLPKFWQAGRRVWLSGATVLSSGGASTFTAVNLAAWVPPGANAVAGTYSAVLTGAGFVIVAADGSYTGQQNLTGPVAGTIAANFDLVPLISTQEIFYYVSGGTANITITSYTFAGSS